jgi:hypothetical protein
MFWIGLWLAVRDGSGDFDFKMASIFDWILRFYCGLLAGVFIAPEFRIIG